MSRIFFAYFFFFQLFFLLSLGCWFISHLNLRFCFLEQANRELVQTLCAIWCMVFCQEYNLKHDSQKKASSIKKQRKLLCRNSTKQLPKSLIWGISIKALRPRSKIFSKQYGKTFDSKILQRSTIWQSRQHPTFRQADLTEPAAPGIPAAGHANPSSIPTIDNTISPTSRQGFRSKP